MKSKPRPPVFLERIDKLTRSIENAQTGDSLPTKVRPLTPAQAKKLEMGEWSFNWPRETTIESRQVYQLNATDNTTIVHGLISLEAKPDHVFMHLVESAVFNKGRQKAYLGVLGNLVAFACRQSFGLGFDGFVSFDSKTALKAHYADVLGAEPLGGLRMYVGTVAAYKLVNQYYPDFFPA